MILMSEHWRCIEPTGCQTGSGSPQTSILLLPNVSCVHLAKRQSWVTFRLGTGPALRRIVRISPRTDVAHDMLAFLEPHGRQSCISKISANMNPPSASRGTKGGTQVQNPPLQPRHVWAIRTHLHLAGRKRDLALFNLAIDSKLRGCDLVRLKVEDVAPSGYAVDRATVRQRKTGRPVKFELTEQTTLVGR